MFKYSSTHIISSNKDFYVNEVGTEGAKETSPLGASFVVGKNDKFFEKTVVEVRKALPVKAVTESIKFTMPDMGTENELCRLYLYVRSVDNADPLYANDWIFKGKPFLIEFKAGTSASDAAENLVKNSNKWLNFVFGKKVLKVTADGTDVTIEALEDTNLRFYKVSLQKFVLDNDIQGAASFYADGGFVSVAGWSSNNEVQESFDEELEVEYLTKGNSGFGTYDYLLRNLRLPTNANMLWNSVNSLAGEMPQVGAEYVQYIVKQCTERPEMQGTSVVGQYNKSVTYHILWVLNNEALISEFEEGLSSIGLDEFASIENEEESTDDTTTDGSVVEP